MHHCAMQNSDRSFRTPGAVQFTALRSQWQAWRPEPSRVSSSAQPHAGETRGHWHSCSGSYIGAALLRWDSSKLAVPASCVLCGCAFSLSYLILLGPNHHDSCSLRSASFLPFCGRVLHHHVNVGYPATTLSLCPPPSASPDPQHTQFKYTHPAL